MALNFSEGQLAELRQDVYGGYRRTAPSTDRYGRKRAGTGGQIDYGYYGGRSGRVFFGEQPTSTQENWGKIAGELGINKVDSTADLQKMYDYVTGYQSPAQRNEFQKQLADQASATQADIAKQLQIVQQEKSAVAKMQEDYAASLMAEADAKRQAQEEAELALRTSQANKMRAGQQANLQIQPAGQIPRTAGTQRFKMRGQFPTTRQALTSGLNIGQSKSLNLG